MSRRTSSSARVRFFRPSLESLEERIVLSNAGYVSLLNELGNVKFLLSNEAKSSLNQVYHDAADFNGLHDQTNLVKLVFDGLNFIQSVNQLTPLATLFANAVKVGEAAGVVVNSASTSDELSGTNQDATHFDSEVATDETVLAHLQKQIGIVEGWIFQALIEFDTHGSNPLPIPTASPTQTTQTSGAVTETINNAPPVASATGGPITESVTVENPSNSDVAVKLSYSATDGTFASVSDNCTNGTITDPLTVPASAAGVVGTWTTSVTGLPDQTNTTTWTA